MYENNNPVDSMIKAKGSSALKTLIDTNLINLATVEWVERAAPPHTEEMAAPPHIGEMAAPHTNEIVGLNSGGAHRPDHLYEHLGSVIGSA